MAFADARGATGELRAGGRRVAGLCNWIAIRDAKADTWTIGGGLVDPNPIWLAQAATFDVVLDMGKAPWRWRRVPSSDVTVVDASINIVTHGRFER
jgi:hypothetical protein